MVSNRSNSPTSLHQTRRFTVAAQLFVEAIRNPPWWTVGLMRDIRYHAACCAALAGAGKGIDEMPLDEKTKAHWRNQAVEWLKADLPDGLGEAETAASRRQVLIGQTLRGWKSNADLAGIRDAVVLKERSKTSRRGLQGPLWAELEALLKKVEAR